jgi:predicted ATPase
LIKSGTSRFTGGVYFVSLAPLNDSTFLITAIAETLAFNFFEGKQDQKRQLLDFLKHKHLLLVLDNFEHLIDEHGLKILSELLDEAEGVKVLVTSRSRLGMRGEQVYPLLGLEVPNPDAIPEWQHPLEEAKSYSSIQLFVQIASMRQPGYILTEHSLAPVARLCQTLQGMPLGIELATAWLGIMEPSSILALIQQSLDFLEAKNSSLPERQRSLRAVFDTSWSLLSGEEQKGVKTLSVFRGGFSLIAAEQTGGVSLVILRSLADKSWIQRVEEDRFQVHELLRQYGEEKLTEESSLWRQTNDSFCSFFCSLLQSLDQKWDGANQLDALFAVEADLKNIQHAWRWAVTQADKTQIDRGLHSLSTFYQWRGRFQEGQAACAAAVERLRSLITEAGAELTDLQLLIARLLVWQSIFTNDSLYADQLLKQSYAILDQLDRTDPNVQRCLAFWFLSQGDLFLFKDRKQAFSSYEQSCSLAEGAGDELMMAKALFGLGGILWLTGSFDEASELLDQCLAIMRKLGNKRWIGICLSDLAILSKHRGDLKTAEDQHHESIQILDEIGDDFNRAISIIDFAGTLEWEGKFAESLQNTTVVRQIFRDLGHMPTSIEAHLCLVIAGNHLHLGRYAEAQDSTRQCLLLAKSSDNLQITGFCLRYLGKLALIEGRYHEAQQYLQEGLALLNSVQQNLAAVTHADLTLVARALDLPQQSVYHMVQVLEKTKQLRSQYMICHALPVAALLLADLGQDQRAVEIYSLAWQNSHVNQSKWFEDVIGKKLRQVKSSLAPELARSSWQTGKTLPVWETVEGLIEDFSSA